MEKDCFIFNLFGLYLSLSLCAIFFSSLYLSVCSILQACVSILYGWHSHSEKFSMLCNNSITLASDKLWIWDRKNQIFYTKEPNFVMSIDTIFHCAVSSESSIADKALVNQRLIRWMFNCHEIEFQSDCTDEYTQKMRKRTTAVGWDWKRCDSIPVHWIFTEKIV